MLPPTVPFASQDERADLLEDRVAMHFEAAGFSIVDSATVRERIDRVDAEWGRVYDRLTGRVLPKQMRRFEREVTAALEGELGCSGRVTTTIAVVKAPFLNALAGWDGVQRAVSSTPRALLLAISGTIESGWVNALSLRVGLYAADGEMIGFRTAGIETLVNQSLSRGLDKLPVDRWLRNETHLREAFDLALGVNAARMRLLGAPGGEIDAAAVDWPGAE